MEAPKIVRRAEADAVKKPRSDVKAPRRARLEGGAPTAWTDDPVGVPSPARDLAQSTSLPALRRKKKKIAAPVTEAPRDDPDTVFSKTAPAVRRRRPPPREEGEGEEEAPRRSRSPERRADEDQAPPKGGEPPTKGGEPPTKKKRSASPSKKRPRPRGGGQGEEGRGPLLDLEQQQQRPMSEGSVVLPAEQSGAVSSRARSQQPSRRASEAAVAAAVATPSVPPPLAVPRDFFFAPWSFEPKAMLDLRRWQADVDVGRSLADCVEATRGATTGLKVGGGGHEGAGAPGDTAAGAIARFMRTMMTEDARWRLVTLDLSDCYALTDGGWRQVARACVSLTALDLSRCHRLTDRSMQTLAHSESAPRLASLGLAALPRVSDLGALALFAVATRVRRVDLAHCPRLGDEFFANFGTPALEAAILDGMPRMTDDAVGAFLRRCTTTTMTTMSEGATPNEVSSLRVLSLGEAGALTDAVARQLTHSRVMYGWKKHDALRRLERFELTENGAVTNGFLLKLVHACARGLKRLCLRDCAALGDSPLILGELGEKFGQRLVDLDVSGTALSDEALVAFATKAKKAAPPPVVVVALRDLDLSRCRHVGEAGVLAVAAACATRLRTLRLSDAPEISDQALMGLGVHCTNLRTLTLRNLTRTSDSATLIVARRCRHLESADFSKSALNARVLTELCQLRFLTRLDVSECHHLDDGAFDAAPVRLVALRCARIHRLTDAGVHRIADRCTRLRALDLRGCARLTHLALPPLLEPVAASTTVIGRPRTRMVRVDLDGCDRVDVDELTKLVAAKAHYLRVLTELPTEAVYVDRLQADEDFAGLVDHFDNNDGKASSSTTTTTTTREKKSPWPRTLTIRCTAETRDALFRDEAAYERVVARRGAALLVRKYRSVLKDRSDVYRELERLDGEQARATQINALGRGFACRRRFQRRRARARAQARILGWYVRRRLAKRAAADLARRKHESKCIHLRPIFVAWSRVERTRTWLREDDAASRDLAVRFWRICVKRRLFLAWAMYTHDPQRLKNRTERDQTEEAVALYTRHLLPRLFETWIANARALKRRRVQLATVFMNVAAMETYNSAPSLALAATALGADRRRVLRLSFGPMKEWITSQSPLSKRLAAAKRTLRKMQFDRDAPCFFAALECYAAFSATKRLDLARAAAERPILTKRRVLRTLRRQAARQQVGRRSCEAADAHRRSGCLASGFDAVSDNADRRLLQRRAQKRAEAHYEDRQIHGIALTAFPKLLAHSQRRRRLKAVHHKIRLRKLARTARASIGLWRLRWMHERAERTADEAHRHARGSMANCVLAASLALAAASRVSAWRDAATARLALDNLVLEETKALLVEKKRTMTTTTTKNNNKKDEETAVRAQALEDFARAAVATHQEVLKLRMSKLRQRNLDLEEWDKGNEEKEMNWKAAVTVGRFWRGFVSRRDTREYAVHRAFGTLAIQSCLRRWLGRRRAHRALRHHWLREYLVQEKELEAMAREDRDRRVYLMEEAQWLVIQRFLKVCVAQKSRHKLNWLVVRLKAKGFREERDAVLENARLRERARRDYEALRHWRALSIQAFVRGFFGRRFFKTKLQHKLETAAALKLETRWRTTMARRLAAARRREQEQVHYFRTQRRRQGRILRGFLGLKQRRTQRAFLRRAVKLGLDPLSFTLSATAQVAELRADAREMYRDLAVEYHVWRRGGVFDSYGRSIVRHDLRAPDRGRLELRQGDAVRIIDRLDSRRGLTAYLAAVDRSIPGTQIAELTFDHDGAAASLPFVAPGTLYAAPRKTMCRIETRLAARPMDPMAVARSAHALNKYARRAKAVRRRLVAVRTIQCAVRQRQAAFTVARRRYVYWRRSRSRRIVLLRWLKAMSSLHVRGAESLLALRIGLRLEDLRDDLPSWENEAVHSGAPPIFIRELIRRKRDQRKRRELELRHALRRRRVARLRAAARPNNAVRQVLFGRIKKLNAVQAVREDRRRDLRQWHRLVAAPPAARTYRRLPFTYVRYDRRLPFSPVHLASVAQKHLRDRLVVGPLARLALACGLVQLAWYAHGPDALLQAALRKRKRLEDRKKGLLLEDEKKKMKKKKKKYTKTKTPPATASSWRSRRLLLDVLPRGGHPIQAADSSSSSSSSSSYSFDLASELSQDDDDNGDQQQQQQQQQSEALRQLVNLDTRRHIIPDLDPKNDLPGDSRHARDEATRVWAGSVDISGQFGQSPHLRVKDVALYHGAWAGHPTKLFSKRAFYPEGEGLIEFLDGHGAAEEERCLRVVVLRARDLRVADLTSISDPFARIECNGRIFNTAVKRSNLNPVFDEVFEIDVSDPQEHCRVSVWDWDRFSAPDFLGDVVIEPGHIPRTAKNPQEPTMRAWFFLGDYRPANLLCNRRTDPMKRKQLHDRGMIELELTWHLRPAPEDLDRRRTRRRGATKLQCWARGRLAVMERQGLEARRTEARDYVRHAATQIQKCVRALMGKKLVRIVRFHRAAARRLQAFFRRRLAWEDLQRKRKHFWTALKLQLCVRRFIVHPARFTRTMLLEWIEAEYSVVILHCFFRAALARREMKRRRAKMKLDKMTATKMRFEEEVDESILLPLENNNNNNSNNNNGDKERPAVGEDHRDHDHALFAPTGATQRTSIVVRQVGLYLDAVLDANNFAAGWLAWYGRDHVFGTKRLRRICMRALRVLLDIPGARVRTAYGPAFVIHPTPLKALTTDWREEDARARQELAKNKKKKTLGSAARKKAAVDRSPPPSKKKRKTKKKKKPGEEETSDDSGEKTKAELLRAPDGGFLSMVVLGCREPLDARPSLSSEERQAMVVGASRHTMVLRLGSIAARRTVEDRIVCIQCQLRFFVACNRVWRILERLRACKRIQRDARRWFERRRRAALRIQTRCRIVLAKKRVRWLDLEEEMALRIQMTHRRRRALQALDDGRVIRRCAAAVCSSEFDDFYNASRTLDGDPATYWCSGTGSVKNQWILYDMKAPVCIGVVELQVLDTTAAPRWISIEVGDEPDDRFVQVCKIELPPPRSCIRQREVTKAKKPAVHEHVITKATISATAETDRLIAVRPRRDARTGATWWRLEFPSETFRIRRYWRLRLRTNWSSREATTLAGARWLRGKEFSPKILEQPDCVFIPHDTIQVGRETPLVTLRCVADGWPLPRYRWLRDGEPVAGATGPTLDLKSVVKKQTTQVKKFRCGHCRKVNRRCPKNVYRNYCVSCHHVYDWPAQEESNLRRHDLVVATQALDDVEPTLIRRRDQLLEDIEHHKLKVQIKVSIAMRRPSDEKEDEEPEHLLLGGSSLGDAQQQQRQGGSLTDDAPNTRSLFKDERQMKALGPMFEDARDLMLTTSKKKNQSAPGKKKKPPVKKKTTKKGGWGFAPLRAPSAATEKVDEAARAANAAKEKEAARRAKFDCFEPSIRLRDLKGSKGLQRRQTTLGLMTDADRQEFLELELEETREEMARVKREREALIFWRLRLKDEGDPAKLDYANFEGVYTCEVSNLRGGTVERVVPTRRIAVVVGDPPPLPTKVIEDYNPRPHLRRRIFERYASMHGFVRRGVMLGDVVVRYASGETYMGPLVAERWINAMGVSHPAGRDADHWGAWVRPDGTMIEGTSVDNHFDTRRVEGNFRITYPPVDDDGNALLAFESNMKNTKNDDDLPSSHVRRERYEGQVVEFQRHGVGEYAYRDGSKYRGEWHLGHRQGFGELLARDGSSYVGEWDRGRIHGQGTWRWADGSSYTGETFEGERAGRGVYISAMQDVYVGHFAQNDFNGRGVMSYHDGSRFEGTFNRNKRQGLGVFTTVHGAKFIGPYVNDQRHGEFVVRRPVTMDEDSDQDEDDKDEGTTTTTSTGAGGDESSAVEKKQPEEAQPRSLVRLAGAAEEGEEEETAAKRLARQRRAAERRRARKLTRQSSMDRLEAAREAGRPIVHDEIQQGLWERGEFVEWLTPPVNPLATLQFCRHFEEDEDEFDGVYALLIARKLPKLPWGVQHNHPRVKPIIARIKREGGALVARDTLEEVQAELQDVEPEMERRVRELEVAQTTLAEFRELVASREATLQQGRLQLTALRKKRKLLEQKVEKFWEEDPRRTREAFWRTVRDVGRLELKDFFAARYYPEPPLLLEKVMRSVCILFGERETWKAAQLLLSSSSANADEGDTEAVIHEYAIKIQFKADRFDVWAAADDANMHGRLAGLLVDPRMRPDHFHIQSYGRAPPCILAMVRAGQAFISRTREIRPAHEELLSVNRAIDQMERRSEAATRELAAAQAQMEGPLRDIEERESVGKRARRMLDGLRQLILDCESMMEEYHPDEDEAPEDFYASLDAQGSGKEEHPIAVILNEIVTSIEAADAAPLPGGEAWMRAHGTAITLLGGRALGGTKEQRAERERLAAAAAAEMENAKLRAAAEVAVACAREGLPPPKEYFDIRAFARHLAWRGRAELLAEVPHYFTGGELRFGDPPATATIVHSHAGTRAGRRRLRDTMPLKFHSAQKAGSFLCRLGINKTVHSMWRALEKSPLNDPTFDDDEEEEYPGVDGGEPFFSYLAQEPALARSKGGFQGSGARRVDVDFVRVLMRQAWFEEARRAVEDATCTAWLFAFPHPRDPATGLEYTNADIMSEMPDEAFRQSPEYQAILARVNTAMKPAPRAEGRIWMQANHDRVLAAERRVAEAFDQEHEPTDRGAARAAMAIDSAEEGLGLHGVEAVAGAFTWKKLYPDKVLDAQLDVAYDHAMAFAERYAPDAAARALAKAEGSPRQGGGDDSGSGSGSASASGSGSGAPPVVVVELDEEKERHVARQAARVMAGLAPDDVVVDGPFDATGLEPGAEAWAAFNIAVFADVQEALGAEFAAEFHERFCPPKKTTTTFSNEGDDDKAKKKKPRPPVPPPEAAEEEGDRAAQEEAAPEEEDADQLEHIARIAVKALRDPRTPAKIRAGGRAWAARHRNFFREAVAAADAQDLLEDGVKEAAIRKLLKDRGDKERVLEFKLALKRVQDAGRRHRDDDDDDDVDAVVDTSALGHAIAHIYELIDKSTLPLIDRLAWRRDFHQRRRDEWAQHLASERHDRTYLLVNPKIRPSEAKEIRALKKEGHFARISRLEADVAAQAARLAEFQRLIDDLTTDAAPDPEPEEPELQPDDEVLLLDQQGDPSSAWNHQQQPQGRRGRPALEDESPQQGGDRRPSSAQKTQFLENFAVAVEKLGYVKGSSTVAPKAEEEAAAQGDAQQDGGHWVWSEDQGEWVWQYADDAAESQPYDEAQEYGYYDEAGNYTPYTEQEIADYNVAYYGDGSNAAS